MSLIQAIVLGTVQGLTEFLPVSSSGHLILLQRLLGFKGPEVLFDTFLHLGTLVAVCVVFRGDLSNMGRSLFRHDWTSQDARLFLLIVLGTIPTAAIGLVFRDLFEKLFSEVVLAALMLIVTGCLLFMADRVGNSKKFLKTIGKADAFIVGVVQGLSIVPGLSRSGSTISTGIFLGLERNMAARFSFLLSIPAIAGAGILQVSGLRELDGHLILPLAVGVITSAVTGYVAIRMLLGLVVRRRLSFFSYYCWIVGLGVLLISLIPLFA